MSITDLYRLDGKVAIVTGASSGLGVAFARGLAEAGADVVVAARRPEALRATVAFVEDSGRRALAVETDVTDPRACARLVARTVEEFGRLDVLVNNAGMGTAIPALHESPEEFRKVMALNLDACYWMAQESARVMGPDSSIINISSVLGLTTARLPQAAYSASKAGLLGLTRDLAQQWTGRRGIRVNAVCPGWFATEMTEQFKDDYMERMVEERTFMGRTGRPEELAATVVFLAGRGAGYITGTTICVDGGATIT